MDDRRRIVMIETLTVDGGSTVTTPVPRQRFQLGNHLDSAALEVDEDGALITYEEYHPYGTTSWWASNGSTDVSAKRYRYTGKERDDETGLAYHGARYYAAWLGRWERPDPKPDPKWSRYEYCRCSPTNHVDADGAEPKSVQQQAAENLAAKGVAKAQEVEGNVDLLDPMANLINLGAWALKDTPAGLLAQGKPSEAAGALFTLNNVSPLLGLAKTIGQGFVARQMMNVDYATIRDAQTPAQAEAGMVSMAGHGAQVLEAGLAAVSIQAALESAGGRVLGAGARSVSWEWRPNLPGRGMVDASEVDSFLRRAINVPDDVKFVVDEGLPSNTDARWLNLLASDPAELVTWSRVTTGGTVEVGINPAVLSNEHRLVSSAMHEIQEIADVRAAFAEAEGGMSAADLKSAVGKAHQHALRMEADLAATWDQWWATRMPSQ